MGGAISRADGSFSSLAVHECVPQGGKHKTMNERCQGDPSPQTNPRSDTTCASKQFSPVSSSGLSRTSTKDTIRSVSPGGSSDSQRSTSPSSSAAETGDRLKEAVDRLISEDLVADAHNINLLLLSMNFSVIIADPLLDDCPLIACSAGFTKLYGYELPDVIGRNCLFLIDSATATQDRPCNELFLMQRNARKDGSLFNNVFYMKVLELGSELEDRQPYMVVLQLEVGEEVNGLSEMSKYIQELDVRMEKVKVALSGLFFVQGSMSRESTAERSSSEEIFLNLDLHGVEGQETDNGQETKKGEEDELMTATAAPPAPPKQLYAAFRPEEVRPWVEGRFKHVQKLADAPRNNGAVHLVRDSVSNELIAMKRMPNTWCLNSHEEFLRLHPTECEFPWTDIGCTRFLNSVNFKYACTLEGVYRSEESTFVASTFASEGDLFDVALSGVDPGGGLDREANLAPLVCQLFSGLKQLHDMQISHRDISLENVLLTRSGNKSEVKIIDYGCATTQRIFPCSAATVCGKKSYQAPEMHTAVTYDAFLSDAFAAGVLVYTLMLKDYPFQSTVPGVCKSFTFVNTYGFQEFCVRRKARGSDLKIVNCTSGPLLELLEGLLSQDPKRRSTFGEETWTDGRASVWDNAWIKHYSDKA